MQTTLLLAISVYKFLVRRKKMNIDFVFFDGQLWPYDEWAKIAPLSFFNDDKSLDDVKWFDPSGYNE